MDMQVCRLCGMQSRLIASELSVCVACIRTRAAEAIPIALDAHRRERELFGLPPVPPREGDVRCGLCARDCFIPEGERGFCGLRHVKHGKLHHLAGEPRRGLLHWYHDPLPTNCVADPVCAGHHRLGMHNLAVFYSSCTLDCLFCQNWHFRTINPVHKDQSDAEWLSARDLASCANDRTHCVCFFGGDPASQMPHSLAVGHYLAEKGIVVCWETAGTMHPRLLRRALEISLASGGCIKFDLKAYDQDLHRALTGASNARPLENFSLAASLSKERPKPPLVIASTLLVPGYIETDEVKRIAGFIADLDPAIPYVLLGFHPQFHMADLPCTSLSHAMEAREAAEQAGLQQVRIGNLHVLGQSY
jgi:pyruvate formate lyase activating enzyme